MSERQDEVVRRLIGRDPTADERHAATAYGDLRWALRGAREDARLSQTDIAQGMALAQSEVSRLETSIGPMTRIGRMYDYLRTCRAQMQVDVMTCTDRTFRVPIAGSARLPAASRDALIDGIAALDATLRDATDRRLLDAGQAAWLREAFLQHLRRQPVGNDAAEVTRGPALGQA